MLTIREYVKAESLAEAYELNQKRSNRVIGGMLWLRLGSGNVNKAIDLSGLGLEGIEENEEEFSIGAMTTLRQLELHEGLNRYTGGAVRECVRHIVGVQFRNLATVGGSIYGRFGFSDVLTMFLALDCQVELYKGGILPLETFAAAPRDRDVLVRIHVKKRPAKAAYLSMRNNSTDFPVLTCAAVCLDGAWQAAIGARPGRAVLIRDQEQLLSGTPTFEEAKAFAGYVQEHLTTGSNMRASAEYRKTIAGVLVRRACMQTGGM